MEKYRNVVIVPYSELLADTRGLSYHKGGPIWPDWSKAEGSRHCKGGKAVDDIPDAASNQALITKEDRELAWCGPIVFHFGHQIADFSTRIPLYTGSDYVLCFAVPLESRLQYSWAPDFFRQMLEYFGVPEERVLVVNRPILASTLYCAPQQEQLGTNLSPEIPPSNEYLELLDSFSEKLKSREKKKYFFSRAAQTKGVVAGEACLESVFSAAGYEVVRPEEHSLLDQLCFYMNASTLVFTEGSALHGLQLLGHVDADLHVLVRRPGREMGRTLLSPRVRSIHYHEVGALMHSQDSRASDGLVPSLRLVVNVLRELEIPFTSFPFSKFLDQVLKDCASWKGMNISTDEVLDVYFGKPSKFSGRENVVPE